MSTSAIPSVSSPCRAASIAHREHPDECAVIERAGHLVEAGRFEQLVGLSEDASLGGPEHEVERDRRHGSGEQRDEHDLATEPVEVAEDRQCVPPDPHDGDDLAVDLDGEVRTQDVAHGQGAPTDSASATGWNPAVTAPPAAVMKSGVSSPRMSTCVAGVGQQDRSIRQSDLDAQDLARGDKGVDLRLERGSTCRGQATRLEIGWNQVGVREAADGRSIRTDDGAEHRLRRLRRHDDRLTQSGQADDHEEEAEDDDQQHWPSERPERRSEQGLTPGDGLRTYRAAVRSS